MKFLMYIGFIFFLIYWFLILPFKPSVEKERQQPPRKKAKDGKINIDYIPDNGKRSSSSKGYDGGEYVDYEEIK
jgi:hypothetical protein